MSWQPAAIAGLDTGGHGGPIAAGAPAHLCVIDRAHQWVVEGRSLASKSRNTPWEGWKLTGKVRHTIYAGTPTVRDFEATK
jgi:dihydroorotase